MSREAPVRFREGLGVKFPRATRLLLGLAGTKEEAGPKKPDAGSKADASPKEKDGA